MRGGIITTNDEIGNLQPTEGTHWVRYMSETFFDSNGCPTFFNGFHQEGIEQYVFLGNKI